MVRALTTQGDIVILPCWLGQYHDVALTKTAFDAEAVTKHQFPLILYVNPLVGLSLACRLSIPLKKK